MAFSYVRYLLLRSTFAAIAPRFVRAELGSFGKMSTSRTQKVIRPQRAKLNAPTMIVFGLLVAIPSYALSRLSPQVDWKVLVGAPLALSVFAFFAYRSDKRSSEAGEWRIPESTLHFVALIGGWPGAFLAQRTFRHKTSKVSFQVVFWLVVLVHEFAAVDSLLNWRFTKDALRAIKSRTAN